jgi:ribosome-associated toxin RatA of RatAB toxin-antitoxin module
VFAFVLAVALGCAADSPPVRSDLDQSAGAPTSTETLKNGVHVEELEVDGVKGLRARFRVKAPADVVLQTLWDVHRFREIFPDIHALDVLAEKEGEIDARFTVDAVLATVHYTLRRNLDRVARTVKWKNIDGDLKYVRGSWTVSPVDGDAAQSDVIYTSFVDVGAFVPTSMVRGIAMSKLEQMATRVRSASSTAPKTAPSSTEPR